jgi:hypothetical protein
MPDPTPSPPQAQLSPLDQYMQSYGEQLQSMLANDPNQGQPSPDGSDPAMAAAGSTANLGPDLYRGQAPPAPQSALQGPPGAPQGSSQPTSALGPTQGKGSDPGAQDGTSFRDLWQKQTAEQRNQYLDKLQNHLKQTDETIDSAYKTMMQQLGGRPDTSISKSQKGMLLMEFGLRMMEHSRSVPGQTNSTAGAIGQAGTETLGSYKGLVAQKQAQQQRYDQMQQQLTIAQGKEKSQLAARSALEEGRDIRAFGQQDASIARTGMQQAGAEQRTQERGASALERTNIQEGGKNQRFAASQGNVTRTVQGDDGMMYGVTKQGQLTQLTKGGQPLKAGGSGPGGRPTAAQANFKLYMDTYGTDPSGQPLEGSDLKKAQQDALSYAANPHTFQLTDPQMRQMAQKSADSFIRANPLSFTGMSADEIQAKHGEVAEQEYQRLKRGGNAGTGVRSALSPSPTKTPTTSTPSKTSGALPSVATQPQPNGRSAPPAAMEFLRNNPTRAPEFLKKYGYLPSQYHNYLTPRSAPQ